MKGFSDSLLLSSWKVVVQDLSLVKKRRTTDTGQKPSSMTLNFINNRSRNPAGRQALRDDGLTTSGRTASRGFTLIELLVVVLIIGILAAVALPQYEKAVEKARIAEAISVLKTISQAQQAYFMATGSYATENELDKLDIEIPGTLVGNRVSSKYFVYSPAADNPHEGLFIAFAQRLPFASRYYLAISRENPSHLICGTTGAGHYTPTRIQQQLCDEINLKNRP